MEVPPTPGQWGYDYGNATVRNANETSGPGTKAPVGYNWMDWINWTDILILVIAPLGLPGNITDLWLLGFRIRRNSFSVYILNLAAADSLFLCATLLSVIVYVVCGFEVTLLWTQLSMGSYSVGLSLLAAISTERCLSSLFPIWYRCRRPKHTSAAVCALIWALSILITVLFEFVCYSWSHSNLCDCFLMVLAAWFFLHIPVLCVSSLTLLLRVRCSSQRRQPPTLYGLVLLTVLVFLLCGLPFGVIIAVPSLRFHDAPLLCLVLACVNSSANPFIYFFLGSQRRRRGRESLRVVLQRALGGEEDLEDERRDTFHTITRETSS